MYDRGILFDRVRAHYGPLKPDFVADFDKAIDAFLACGAPPVSAVLAGPIAMVDAALLRIAASARSLAELEPWAAPIRSACVRFEMTTIRRVAAFIAQMAHESGLIPGRVENLNYSAKRLAEVWPGRYAINPKAEQKDRLPNALAKAIGGKPEAVANNVYANRLGNGDAASGDGWRFRGQGPGQLTGRDNWTRFAAAMKMPVEQALAYGATLEGGVMSFAWFWEENDINRLADTPGVADESRKINGGANGLADRTAKFNALVAEMLVRERRG